MTMSCDAEPNAMSRAITAMTPTSVVCANPASARIDSHQEELADEDPRPPAAERPKRGPKRSMSGDQRNLKLHGACASEKRPTVLMSTPR